MFVDADDYITANTIRPFLEYVQQTDSDLAIASMRRVSRGGSQGETKLKNKLYDSSNLYTLNSELDALILGSPCLKLFRRDIIEKYAVQFNESLPLFEDAVFVYEYLRHCSKVVTSDTILYNYVVNGNSATAKFRGEDFINCLFCYRNAQIEFINSGSMPPEKYQHAVDLIDRNIGFQVLFAIYTIYRAPNRPKKGQYAVLKKYAETFKEIIDKMDKTSGIPKMVFTSLKIHPSITHCLLKTIFTIEKYLKS